MMHEDHKIRKVAFDVTDGQKTPNDGQKTPDDGKKTPDDGKRHLPFYR